MKRKLLAIILSTILTAGVLGGCGEKSSNPDSTAKTEKEAEEVTIRLGVMTNYADQYLAVVGKNKGFLKKMELILK